MITKRWMLGFLVGVCLVGWTFADDEPPAVIPVAVSNAVARFFPGAVIEKVEAEVETIKVFELEIEQGDLEADITITPEGLVLEVETEVALNRIPPAVRKTLKGLAEREDIKEVSQETVYCDIVVKRHKSPKVAYEADVQKDGRMVTFKIDSVGKILASEVEDHAERGDHEERDADEIKGPHRDRDEEADDQAQAERHEGEGHSAEMRQHHEPGDHEDNEADVVREQSNPGDEEDDDQGRVEHDDDPEILLDIHEIPRAVRATIDRHLKDGKVTEIELKIDNGHIVYAVEVTQGEHEIDLLISPRGKVLGTEDEAAEQGSDKDRTNEEKGT